MIGKYPAKLDEKSRLFVPSKLRMELGDTFSSPSASTAVTAVSPSTLPRNGSAFRITTMP